MICPPLVAYVFVWPMVASGAKRRSPMPKGLPAPARDGVLERLCAALGLLFGVLVRTEGQSIGLGVLVTNATGSLTLAMAIAMVVCGIVGMRDSGWGGVR